MPTTTERPPTTAPHDVQVRLVQRAGPVTDNCLGMLAGAARGYADGPCKGLVGRIVLERLRETTGLRPRALEADLARVLDHLQPELAARGMRGAVELVPGADPAILVQPLAPVGA